MTQDPKSPALSELSAIAEALSERFAARKTVLSFAEYLELFAENPLRHGREAATYLRDMFDHYGCDWVDRPTGRVERFRLFDAPWASEDGKTEAREPRLVGNEELQNAIYRVLGNFVSDGRANKLLLMHGPNGSAKSTTAACILRGLEHYSTLEEGALYRFHWVFPSRKTTRGAIGFGEAPERTPHGDFRESFAHLPDDQIDARLHAEIRDHPLLLLPLLERKRLLSRLYEKTGQRPPHWLETGLLSHKNQQVMQALLIAEHGNLRHILRHVMVERWLISRKYRQGAVTLGPELSIDAGERQVTADRSLSALPTALQATTLFEAHGELIEAAGGMLEFSDLLKRPIDSFRYLQLTLETGEINLPHQNIQTNVVMLGSANEIHLAAFKEHHEFPSFRGRFELVNVPYLRRVTDERRIYEQQVAPHLGMHIAPHATSVAAEFAVLTRLQKPSPDRYPSDVAKIVKDLTVEQKLDLYDDGEVPESLDNDARKLLRANLSALYREADALVEYEGVMGASPRTMRTVLLNAAQAEDYNYLSPFAVLSELDELCKQTSEYDFLREKAQAGGYNDTKEMRAIVRRRLLDRIEEDMRACSGLVEPGKYTELFDRYIQHVSVWVKGETVRNSVTGDYEKADERMMREVEGFLGIESNAEDHRRNLISSIAAWAIDHSGQKVVYETVFPGLVKKLHDSVFAERKKPVALLVRDLVTLLRTKQESANKEPDLGDARRRETTAMLERLRGLGYDERSALDSALAVLGHRMQDAMN